MLIPSKEIDNLYIQFLNINKNGSHKYFHSTTLNHNNKLIFLFKVNDNFELKELLTMLDCLDIYDDWSF